MDNCGYVWLLPRIVLALQELVLRLASQSSTHEETNINTFYKPRRERSTFKNNNDESVEDVRPRAALCGSVSALKASQAGAQGGGLRSVGASLGALWSCGRFSHDICALTYGRVSLLSAGGGREGRVCRGGFTRIGLEYSLLLPLSPAPEASTHAYTRARRQRSF